MKIRTAHVTHDVDARDRRVALVVLDAPAAVAILFDKSDDWRLIGPIVAAKLA